MHQLLIRCRQARIVSLQSRKWQGLSRLNYWRSAEYITTVEVISDLVFINNSMTFRLSNYELKLKIKRKKNTISIRCIWIRAGQLWPLRFIFLQNLALTHIKLIAFLNHEVLEQLDQVCLIGIGDRLCRKVDIEGQNSPAQFR